MAHKKPEGTGNTGSEQEVSYWRSFGELYKDPEFRKLAENEFGERVTEDFDTGRLTAFSRRKFLALLSASAAFAAAGCANYRDRGEIIPYNQKPEEITPGLANYYASTCTGCNNVCGILVKTREGRPVKIDGSPDHPVNKGKICAKGQAGVLNLYDPGRIKSPLFSPSRNGHAPVSWQEVDDKVINELKNASASGKEIALVAHSVQSPALKKLLEDFRKTYPTAKVYSYELFNDSQKRSAWNKCYGRTALPVIKWDEARVILALESDFLGNEGNVMEQTRLRSAGRDVMKDGEFNRLYSVEGGVSLTGLNADYRIRLRTDSIEEFVLCLLNEFLVKRQVSSAGPQAISFVRNNSLEDFRVKNKIPEDIIRQLTDDLLRNRGTSMVIAGEKLPESTHIAVNFLNEVLGNSRLYSKEAEQAELLPLSPGKDIENLVSGMNSGNVGVLIHLESNPVFHFSPDHAYAAAAMKVPIVVTMTQMPNETCDVSNYILPVNHDLESWGDFKTRTGFYSLQQPVISPLYDSRQKEAVLHTWLSGSKDSFSHKVYHEYLMKSWEMDIYPAVNTPVDFKKFWYSVLHDGVALVKEKFDALPPFNTDAFVSGSGKMKAGSGLVLLLQGNNTVGDGRFANNGWLQELPNTVSKVVWDNYAAVSVQTAFDLGLKQNDKAEITVDGRTAVFPVLVQPGMADGVVEVQLGYGRTKAGDIGSNVGVNANVLIGKNNELSGRLYSSARIKKAEGTHELVTVQEHHAIEDPPLLAGLQKKREIIREGIYEEYRKDPDFLKKEKETVHLENISTGHDYEGYKWGMAIDLNKCTGCSVCTIACYVENNIPVVGKEQVKLGREMSWIRIDRYYSGPPDSPAASFQPMLCQHCDNAPCENVCPVSATNHSSDGLNQMAYNRCVGTRYCSNNCPYKVRRFNFFNFRDHLANAYYDRETLNLMYNPEVTVRSRGVMEKCTFCVQRIMDERQHAIQDKREVNGDNVMTACQEACPADAIVFGDLNKKESPITKYREHSLAYHVLEELNVRPNVDYIAKLKNINPERS